MIKFNAIVLATVITATQLGGCSMLVSRVANNFGNNLTGSILNQDDPELVRAGMPSYILLLDSFLQGEEHNPAILSAAATMFASYGAVFASDPVRARRLTGRSLEYADEAICISLPQTCGWRDRKFDDFAVLLGTIEEEQAELLFNYGFAWLAFIRAHSNEFQQLAKLPEAQALLQRYIDLSGETARPSAHSYLGILMTIRGSLGGTMDEGREHFEVAISRTDGRDLSAKLEYLKGYARNTYDRELNDRLCAAILEESPYADGLTLTNVLAQEEAATLCAEADDYF